MSHFLLGIDQGTSGSKALIIAPDGVVVGFGYRPLDRIYPQPGWVEQSPAAVVAGVRAAIADALAQAGLRAGDIAACGIASQRNTAFAWDHASGAPIGNAITWQDLRSVPLLAEARARFDFADAWRRLGYPPGPYMAALHLAWRMQHDRAFRGAAEAGTLRVGLASAYLAHALGRPAGHLMDASLVQSLGFYDFRTAAYWDAWRAWTGVPLAALPAVVPTVADYGVLVIDGAEIPLRAQIGDQQAALFGHGARAAGAAECTHGTASYLKLFLGDELPVPHAQSNAYCAWDIAGVQTYCLEAPTTVTGAAVRWLVESMQLFDSPETLSAVAATVADAAEVVFIPALTGLEVPYHRPDVRGTIVGLTLGHTRAHLARAFLDAIGFQMRAILEAFRQSVGVTVEQLRVGGGVASSDIACQIQADLTGIAIVRPTFGQTTAYAAALLAGLGAGIYANADACPALPGDSRTFEPAWSAERRNAAYARWQHAIAAAMAGSAGDALTQQAMAAHGASPL